MKRLAFLLVLILSLITYFLAPIYQFYAYRHEAPMLALAYSDIPSSGPRQSELFHQGFEAQDEQALTLIEQHRSRINSPGISAAVAIDDELVWAGVSGWADLKSDKPLSTTTLFRIGSTSKALTSVLLARLVDSEKITLDESLSNYAVGHLNSAWMDITPRQLASHMAGIPHYGDNTDWAGLYRIMALNKNYTDVADAVTLFDGSNTLFSPGERFSYSSLGTVLLSAAMQESAGMPFQEAMSKEVLAPLSMLNTFPSSHNAPSERSATFYWHKEDKGSRVKPWRNVNLSHRLAGGGYLSTPSDLVKLGIGFSNDEFVSASTREAFWTAQRLNSGDINEQGYAIGWRVRHTDFGEGIGTVFQANHGGVSRGSQSWLMVIPQYDMAVAININAKTEHFWDFGEVSFDLVRLFLRHYLNTHPDIKPATEAKK